MAGSEPIVEAPRAKLEQYARLRAEQLERERTRVERARVQLLKRFPHPLALLQHFEPATVIVPSVELLSRTWVEVLDTSNGRAVISHRRRPGRR